jgi:DoxX-like protein
MTRSQWRSIIALRLIITLLFAPAILDKLIDPDEYARLFTTWGYPPWGPLVISIIEIIGLVALWIPTLSTSAIATVMVTAAGATGTWWIHGPKSTAAYPGTILVLVASLAWLQHRAMRRNSHIEHPETLSG